MPILQNIQIAEREAETLRLNAHKEVENLLETTKQKSNIRANEIVEEAKLLVKNSNQETMDLINKLEKENLQKIESEKNVLEALAKSNNEVGVNYILKQVFEI